MKWATEDIEIFLREKQYIDTAIIPLIPISLNSDMKVAVAQGEYISILTSELERQFKGRLVHFPAFTYLKSEQEEKFARFNKWIEEILQNDFKYIIALTSDMSWKTFEDKEDCTLLWLPALPLEQMDDREKSILIQNQISQLIPMFTEKWNYEKFKNMTHS